MARERCLATSGRKDELIKKVWKHELSSMRLINDCYECQIRMTIIETISSIIDNTQHQLQDKQDKIKQIQKRSVVRREIAHPRR